MFPRHEKGYKCVLCGQHYEDFDSHKCPGGAPNMLPVNEKDFRRAMHLLQRTARESGGSFSADAIGGAALDFIREFGIDA